MRTWPCAFLIAVSGLFAGPVLAAGQTDGNDCTQAVDVMAACTRVIQNAGASNAIRAKAFTGRGNVHFEKKEYDAAIADYDESIKLDPSAENYDARGFAYYKKDPDNKRAIADLTESIRLDPKYFKSFLHRAWAYENDKDYGRAESDHNEVVRLNPRGHVDRAKFFVATKDYKRAIADYTEARRLYPDDVGILVDRAGAYEKDSDYTHAESDYDEIIRLQPKGYINRAIFFKSRRNYDRAIADYNEAMRRDPTNEDLLFARATVYDAAKQYGNEIADYDEYLRRGPKDRASALLNLGNAYNKMGDYDRAIKSFDLGEKDGLSDYGKMVAYSGRATSYRGKGDWNRAIKSHTEAIKFNATDGAYSDRGDAYLDNNDFSSALADYNESVRLGPAKDYNYRYRGTLYRAMGNYERAMLDYNDAVRLDPEDYDNYFVRGVAYVYAGSLDKARSDLKKASELNAKYAYAALWLDLAQVRGNAPSGLAEAAKSLDMNAWPAPVVRQFLGEMTASQTIAAADNPNPKIKREQVCEANFYAGELALRTNARNEAIRLFRLAAKDCPRSFVEWSSANAELKALGSASH